MANEIYDDLLGMEVPEEVETPRQAAMRHLAHLSGCGHPVSVLEERILEYLRNHGGVGDWHTLYDVGTATFAWLQFGKKVVDPLLLLMVADGSIEIDSWPGPRRLRLRNNPVTP
jgi:hypothetical protein